MKNSIEIKNISYSWGDGQEDEIIQDFSLKIKRGEFVSIVGPSGCGKSTLLKIISGLIAPTIGEIFLNEQKIDKPHSELGFVFQDYSLFPWLSVEQNIAFGPQVNKVNKNIYKKEIEEILRRVGLFSARKKYPHELSGGMKQRTAIARVLANHSDYLLMDEPFGALDYQTRMNMQKFLLEIWVEYKKTILFVTHHVEEAIFLSDRIVLMNNDSKKNIKILEIDLQRPRMITEPKFNSYRKLIIEHLQMG